MEARAFSRRAMSSLIRANASFRVFLPFRKADVGFMHELDILKRQVGHPYPRSSKNCTQLVQLGCFAGNEQAAGDGFQGEIV